MKNKKKSEMVLLSDLAPRLTWPGAPTHISRNSLYIRMKKLSIKPAKIKPEGFSYSVNCVTQAQAQEIEEDFKRTHWRKFKKAE